MKLLNSGGLEIKCVADLDALCSLPEVDAAAVRTNHATYEGGTT